MRHLMLLACLASCATAPKPAPPAALPAAPSVPIPEAVAAAKRHVVAVYYRATCKTLDQAKSRGNGFFVNDKTVATVWHYVEHDKAPPLFPDFAVIGEDGCHDAQPADFDERADIYYLRVYGHHGPPIEIADRAPEPGATVYAVSNRAKKFAPTTLSVFADVVRPREAEEAKMANPPTYTVEPPGIMGDSGSPVLDAQGRVVGMVDAIVDPKGGAKPYGLHISGFMIKLLLEACGPCEAD